MDFKRSDLKTGVENYIFWFEIGTGFGEPATHPHKEFPGVPPGIRIIHRFAFKLPYFLK